MSTGPQDTGIGSGKWLGGGQVFDEFPDSCSLGTHFSVCWGMDADLVRGETCPFCTAASFPRQH